MGRLVSNGLRQFSFDVDFFFDERIRKLIRHQGGKAIAVYALLLCTIYRQGYCRRWDEELSFVCSNTLGYDRAYISEVVKCCVVLGLFDRGLFESGRILTSKAIQKRYLRECKRLKRKANIDAYSLVDQQEQAEAETETAQDGIPCGIPPQIGVGVYAPRSAYKPVAELVEECKRSEAWIESVCITSGLNKECILSELDAFPAHLTAQGYDGAKTMHDFKRHFTNYLRKKQNGNTARADQYGTGTRGAAHAGGERRYGGVPAGVDAPSGYDTTL